MPPPQGFVYKPWWQICIKTSFVRMNQFFCTLMSLKDVKCHLKPKSNELQLLYFVFTFAIKSLGQTLTILFKFWRLHKACLFWLCFWSDYNNIYILRVKWVLFFVYWQCLKRIVIFIYCCIVYSIDLNCNKLYWMMLL